MFAWFDKVKKPLQLICAVLAVVGTGGGIAAFCTLYDFPFVANQAPEAADAYMAAGLPWEAADLNPIRSVGSSENAAQNLKRAILAVPAGFDWEDQRHCVSLADLGRYAEVKAKLRAFEPAFKCVVLASKKPRLDFHRDWDKCFVEDGFPELRPLRTIANALTFMPRYLPRLETQGPWSKTWGQFRTSPF